MRRNLYVSILLSAIFSLLSPFNVVAKTIPIESFTKKAQFDQVKLSPDGNYLAVTVPQEDRNALAIFDRKTMKPTYVYRYQEDNYVSNFYWVNNERLVITRSFRRKSDEQLYTQGQIFAGNIDGTKADIIFGFAAGFKKGGSSRLNKNSGPDRAFGAIQHLLPDDPDHIIISARHMDHDYDSPVRILKLNVYSGKKKLITRTPFGNMRIGLNSKGEPVFTTGVDEDGKERKFFMIDRKWHEIEKDSPLYDYNFLSINTKVDKLYLESHLDGKTDALYEYDFDSKDIKLIFNHPISDVHTYIREPTTRTIVGAEVMPDEFEYHYFEPDNEYAKIHMALAKALQGNDISITSRTNDLNELIVRVQNDKNPGDFYLFNRKSNQLQYMLSKKRWLDPELLSERLPINFKARDGKTIYGYLTKPLNSSQPVPLVTYVHGGPYGISDTWFFDTTPQLLANRGFAVLQVNYRGSGGYGLDYEEVAYKKRHSLIQEDIIDGTRWAIARTDISNKACIMGWSFGGYSALMSPLIEPDLFQCSIAAAGVYDAQYQEDEADYGRIRSVAEGAAAKKYGKDEQLLKEESPLSYIDNLKTPILIVHGGKDRRVPPEQAEKLRRELDKRNLTYEWLFKEREGHGFYNEENRIEFYEKSLASLNKYLNK